MSERMDDSDVEATPVEPGSPAPSSASANHGADGSSFSATRAASPSPVRYVSVAGQRPPAQQLLRAASVAGLLALLIVTGVLVPSGNRAALMRFFTPPTPSPTRVPLSGADAFLWEHFVPWGSLLVDGKPGPDVHRSAVRPNAQGRLESAAFHLPLGRHTLEYRAAPFPTLTCALSVPAAPSDTCPLEPSFDPSFAPGAPATRVLDLQATVDHLPGQEGDALAAAAQAQLSALAQRLGGGALSAGDHFLDFTGDIVQTSVPMQLTPHFALDPSIRNYDGLPCVNLCTQGDLTTASTSTQDWSVVAPVMLTFRYTSATGLVLLAEGPATLIGGSPRTLISLVTRWQDGSWQAPTPIVQAQQTDPVICPMAQQTLQRLLDTTAPSDVHELFQPRFAVSTAEVGCLLTGSAADPATGIPTGPLAWILYRAGALIAANTEAHRMFPTLPLASIHERNLAAAVAPASPA
jgi:hypothetical protein